MKIIKKRLKVKARDKYRNLSVEEKKKKREYGKNRCLSMSEEEKITTKRISKKLSRVKKVTIQ